MKRTKFVLFAVGATAVAAMAAPAYADYTFSDACAPEAGYDLSLLEPNVLMILDRSNSMNNGSGEDVDGGGEDSLFKIAKLTVQDLATANHQDGACAMSGDPGCDDVFLGIGYYAGNSGDDSPDTLDSYVAVAPADDTRDAIIASVSAINAPGGSGTTTGDAAARIATDMTDATRANYGVIITDGATSESGQQRKAVQNLCAARDRAVAPVTTYIVGFGAGSDAANNSLLAAAGGTGSCCEGTAPPCAASAQRDPCDEAVNNVFNADNTRTGITNGWQCEGSLEATGSGLKDALETTLGAASCTFRLDIPADYPDGRAQDDPDATRVRVEMPGLSAGLLDLPHVDDPDSPMSDFEGYLIDVWGVDPSTAATYANAGWYFSNDQRVAVTLTDGLCDAISAGDVTQVFTQVACICELTGESCTVTDGYDGYTNEQLEKMRCTQGVYECIDGEDVCVGSDDPLPEICNGIDDNCDGTTDNLDSAEAEWQAWEDAGNDAKSLHCNYSNVCVCSGGPDVRAPDGATLQQHIDSWSGACTCGEGLAAESPASPAEPAPMATEPQAGCSSASTGLGSTFVLFFGGLFAFGRRRRQAD